MNTIDNIHTLPEELNLHFLDSENSFNQLETDEKLYAYAMYKASWAGALIVSRQISPESEKLIKLFTNMLRDFNLDSLASNELKHFLNYVAMLFSNLGNYLSFGDSKFIPRLDREDMNQLIKIHFPAHYIDYMELEHYIYSLNEDEKYLGYPPQITTYFSSNMTKGECNLVDNYLTSFKLEGWNTRACKETNKDKIIELIGLSQFTNDVITSLYVIKVASAYNSLQTLPKLTKFLDSHFIVQYEDHRNELEQIIKYLTMALNFTHNEIQQKMLAAYIWHFKYGNIDDHKESQKLWVTDKGPSVETNIGFIENYRDPSGIRSEFESFVSIVDKEKTKKFKRLVDASDIFIPMLPWPQEFEKSAFMAPDFTSLDILAFTASGLPAGINIPNYDDVRQNIGFKNVSLDNVIRTGYKSSKLPEHLSEDDGYLYNKYLEQAFAVDVAGHELFGHGSGKLFTESSSGEFNFDTNLINPITGEKIKTWYKCGETWSSKFGKLSSSYEECRAECVGLFLATHYQIHEIFGHMVDEIPDISYVSWLWMVRAGLLGLGMYNPEKKEFLQAHSHARYVIYKVLEEAGIVTINIDTNAFTININRESIPTVGLKALSEFLVKLNIFKATADFENGSKLFSKYSVVDNVSLKIREIYLANSKPRSQYIQPTLKLSTLHTLRLPQPHSDNSDNSDNSCYNTGEYVKIGCTVEYIKYGNTNIDVIKSFLDKNIC